MVSEQPDAIVTAGRRFSSRSLRFFSCLCRLAVVAFVTPLDEIGFLRFPSFFLLAQGLLIGIVALAFGRPACRSCSTGA